MTQARQVVARTCLVQTCCPAATIAAGGGNGVWHGAGKLASLPSLSFPFLLFRLLLALCCVLHLLLFTSPCAITFHSNLVSSPKPTCVTVAVFQHDSLRVSLAAPLLLITRFSPLLRFLPLFLPLFPCLPFAPAAFVAASSTWTVRAPSVPSFQRTESFHWGSGGAACGC